MPCALHSKFHIMLKFSTSYSVFIAKLIYGNKKMCNLEHIWKVLFFFSNIDSVATGLPSEF